MSWEATPANWSGTMDGNQFNTNGTPKGVQITEAVSGVVVTSPKSFNKVKQVVVTYSSSSKGVGSIAVGVGGESIGSQSISKSQTETELTYNVSPTKTGLITITVTCTKNSIGLNAVKIVEEESAPVGPSITLSTKNVNVNAEDHEGTITVGYNNFSVSDVDIVYFKADGTTPANASDYDWLLADINASKNVEYVIAANTSESARSAYFKVYALDDEANDVYSDLITITQAADYATLPFSWAGGVSSDFKALAGVTTSGLGSDYAESNAPYRVKLDTTGDYIQIKTNSQPGKVTIGVKMLGGSTASSITVKASADGESYRDIQTLSISGSQNDILTLATTEAFDPADRYVRLVFTKGSNVGVGPITIVGCVPVTVSKAGFATFCTANALDFSHTVNGVTAYTASLADDVVTFNEIDFAIPENTGILLQAEAGTYYLPFAISSTPISGNVLVGVIDDDTTIDGTSGNYYVLKQIGDNVGFYKVTNAAYKVRKNSAYLDAAKGSAKGFIPVDGTTAIELVDTANEVAAPVYNLQGQRVSEGYKGVVIVNGKKVINK